MIQSDAIRAAKPDLVADAVATLNSMPSPNYSGTSLRDDLITFMEQAGNCQDRPAIVTATMEMAECTRTFTGPSPIASASL